jgi:hypothetical protein
MLKFIKKYFKKDRKESIGNKDVVLKLVYTDVFKNKWYAPEELSDYPFIRLNQIQTYSRYTELKLDNARLIKIADVCMEALKEGRNQDVMILINEIKVAEQLFCEKNTLLKLASAMFLLNNERANSLNEQIEAQKIEIMRNDADAMAFFLPIAYQTLQGYKNNSELQVVEYLQKTLPIIERLNYLILNTSIK